MTTTERPHPLPLLYFQVFVCQLLPWAAWFPAGDGTQIPAAHTNPFLALLICSRAAAAVPQLCTLSCRKAKGGGPAMWPCQERAADQAGSYHPSSSGTFSARWELHSSTPHYAFFFWLLRTIRSWIYCPALLMWEKTSTFELALWARINLWNFSSSSASHTATATNRMQLQWPDTAHC